MSVPSAGPTVFQRETFDGTWAEIQPLIVKHWAEVAHYLDIPLEPDAGAYRAMDHAGLFRMYTARAAPEVSGGPARLIGYAAFFVRQSVHYASSKQAVNDVIFLLPEFRKGGLGRELIQYADRALAAEGVQVVYHHVKAAHNWGPLIERMGYELQDLIYSKRLDTAAPKANP